MLLEAELEKKEKTWKRMERCIMGR